MASVTIRYGSGNTLTKDFPEGTSVGCVLTNTAVKAALGYGNNVQGNVSGVPVPDSNTIYSGMTISVTDKACNKAAPEDEPVADEPAGDADVEDAVASLLND